MLNEEELNDMSELDRGPRFLEVKCDCTNRKYGDFTGRLRISTLAMLCSLASPNPTVRKVSLFLQNLSLFIFIYSYFPEWQWSQCFFFYFLFWSGVMITIWSWMVRCMQFSIYIIWSICKALRYICVVINVYSLAYCDDQRFWLLIIS